MSTAAADSPTITFTSVPAYGGFDNLRGRVGGVGADHGVAVYIKVFNGWSFGYWSKPTWASPRTPIAADLSWVTDVTTGATDQYATEIVAFLIAPGYQPPLAYGQTTLPGDIATRALARTSVTRSPAPTTTVPPRGTPGIRFTFVPAYGTFSDLQGTVSGVGTDHGVAVYIKVHGGYWSKPYWGQPISSIASNLSWVTDITTGGSDHLATEIVAFLIPPGYQPPLASGHSTLPGDIASRALARVSVTRTP